MELIKVGGVGLPDQSVRPAHAHLVRLSDCWRSFHCDLAGRVTDMQNRTDDRPGICGLSTKVIQADVSFH